MGQSGPAVGDQFTRQQSVDIVERFAHGRTVSEPGGTMSPRVQTWQLRAQFAAGLSRLYAAEVPLYSTLVEVSAEVNHHLGAAQRVTAERHGAIRVGCPLEVADVADLFAAFGMYPVGFYDLRDAASPVPVVSTAFRPTDPDELERNPFRVFTSMLATTDARFFSPGLRTRVERFLAGHDGEEPPGP